MTETTTKPTKEERTELLRHARLVAAVQIWEAFREYSKITARIITDQDLTAIATATAIPLEELKQLRDDGAPVLPEWDSFTQDQRESIAFSSEMDEMGWLLLGAVARELNPEAVEKKSSGNPLEDLIDHLVGKSTDVTVITGTYRR